MGAERQAPAEARSFQWKLYFLRRKIRAERALKQYLSTSTGDLSPEARAAVEHGVLTTAGKRVRPVLTFLVHDMVGGKDPNIDTISILTELPHKGSILEDDIDDRAQVRNNQPATYKIFGETATREAYEFLYDSPIRILNSLPLDPVKRQRAISEYERLVASAREGQRKDILWGESAIIPTIDQYLTMCAEKGAALEAAVRVGAEFGGATTQQTDALGKAGNKLAVVFQLVDDLLSLREGREDFGDDITEGKKTIPVIHAVKQNTPQSRRLLEILAMKTHDPLLLHEATEIVAGSGGIELTENIVRRLVEESKELVADAVPDSKRRKIFFSLLSYGIQRNN